MVFQNNSRSPDTKLRSIFFSPQRLRNAIFYTIKGKERALKRQSCKHSSYLSHLEVRWTISLFYFMGVHWSPEWSREKANRDLPRECTGHSKHPLPTTQETILHMDITRWSIPKSYWLYSLRPKLEKLYIVSKNNTGSWLWLRSWTLCKIETSIVESRESH